MATHKMKPIIMLATPVFAGVHRRVYHSHKALTYYCGREMTDYDFAIAGIDRRVAVATARNTIVRAALRIDADWILWMDDDQTVPEDACERLLARKKDIVCGLSFIRSQPYHAMLIDNSDGVRWVDDYPEGLIEADACPFGCALTHTKVFKKMMQPWFWDQPGRYSEDVYFARKAKAAGFKVWADTTVKTGHLGEPVLIDETFAKAYWATQKSREIVDEDACPIPRETRGKFETVTIKGSAEGDD